MEAKKDTYTPVSVVMIVKNEAKIIRPCLEAASWADEIVVLDTGSEDATIQICKDFGAKVFLQETWEGFGKARQVAVKYATNDWIFSLDADEYASNELIGEISHMRNNGFDKSAYRIEAKSYYLGKMINYCGWQNESHISLFDRRKGTYNDAVVHESLILSGEVGRLKGIIHHHTYPTKDTHLTKMIRYGELGAIKLKNMGKSSNPLKALLRGAFTFIKMYILRMGFLDGAHGFSLCKTTAWGTWYKYHRLWQLRKS
jgi:glycosyltransferase involved in cell wall biosynthesis